MSTIQDCLDESWRHPRRLRNTIRLGCGELQPELAQTPCEEVASWGRVRLVRYQSEGPQVRAPLLLIPSIINRHYVLDLRPGQSYVEHLCRQGIPVYLIDWGRPGPQDRYATMEQHVLKWMHAAVRATCRHAGTSQVHLMGYCIGGTMAVMYAALRPERVAGLIALTAPVNFHDDGLLAAWVKPDVLDVERLEEELGLIPCEFLQSSFLMLKPTAHPIKFWNLWKNLWSESFVERFLALETWVNDGVDLPGPTYRYLIRDLYQQNGLMEETLELGGETVRMRDVHCPVLVACAEFDHIVPDPSAALLHEKVSSEDRTLLRVPGGHIGCVVGGAARKNLWPRTVEWLAARRVA